MTVKTVLKRTVTGTLLLFAAVVLLLAIDSARDDWGP